LQQRAQRIAADFHMGDRMKLRHRSRLTTALALALGVAIFGAHGVATAEEFEKAGKPAAASSANAAVLAAQILARWEPVAEAAGAHHAAWKEVFGTQLALMDARTLARLDALDADVATAQADYAKFTQAFLDAQFNRVMNSEVGKTNAKLGPSGPDRVFIPTVPCRVVDTRNVGGVISANTTRNFYYYSNVASYNFGTAQGGAPGQVGTVCPQLVYGDNAPMNGAAALTVQVVSPTAAGNWIVWGGANPIPTVSALNWTGTGQILTNTTVVPGGGRSGSGSGGGILDFAVRYNGPSGSAHFIADVVGYFVPNLATALNCVTTDNFGTGTVAVGGGVMQLSMPACTAGYTATGWSCDYNGTLPSGAVLQEITGYFNYCLWRNFSASALTGSNFGAHSRCCRVPGR
jgi:hypothetical protein